MTRATLSPAQTKLVDLYREYMVADDVRTEEIANELRVRGELAESMLAPVAAELSQLEIDDMIERLMAANQPRPGADEALDTAEREIARVQLLALEAERHRREQVVRAIEAGDTYAPPRSELTGSVMSLAMVLEARGADDFEQTFKQVANTIRRTCLNTQPGTPRVAAVLREMMKPPTGYDAEPIEPWIRWAVALELLTLKHGFAGERVELDAVTRGQATLAKRLLYATERQDSRYGDEDWPLDLSGEALANMLEAASEASRRWAERGTPETDMHTYLTPTRREEVGRPDPHPQIVPEAEARRLAEKAGGFPDPLVYPIPPQQRARLSRTIWTHGLPPVLVNKPGLTLYPAAGDPRIRWGAQPYPYGLLCAVALPQNFVLRVAHPDYPEDHEAFSEITRRASSQARGDHDYPEIVRNSFLSQGYYAIAHYNEAGRYLHELTVLRPGPETVMVVRETVPSFMRGDRPLSLPKNRGSRGRMFY